MAKTCVGETKQSDLDVHLNKKKRKRNKKEEEKKAFTQNFWPV